MPHALCAVRSAGSVAAEFCFTTFARCAARAGLHLFVHAVDAALSTLWTARLPRRVRGSHSAQILVSCPLEGIGFQKNSP